MGDETRQQLNSEVLDDLLIEVSRAYRALDLKSVAENTAGETALAAALYASPEPLYRIEFGSLSMVAVNPWPFRRFIETRLQRACDARRPTCASRSCRRDDPDQN